MSFQTIFYEKDTGVIVNIIPNKYIKSKLEKLRFCPGYEHVEVNFMYFPSRLEISAETHHVKFIDATHPPLLCDASGMPLYFSDRVQLFLDAKKQYSTIIIELNDGVGDYLIQVSSVIEAMRVYPETKFYIQVPPGFADAVRMCPDVTVFDGYTAHGLDPKRCGKIKLNGSLVQDPRGPGYGKASLYGLFLNLPFAPYVTRLVPPPEFDAGFAAFDARIGLRADCRNVFFHLRTKNWEEKSWEIGRALDLAHMIKTVYDCNIYYSGSAIDWIGESPDMINLAGKTTWLETLHLLRSSSHRICIDSAPMHLCRALGLDCIRLWGFSHPRLILGEAPGPLDIVDDDSSSKTNIKDVSALRVFETAFPEFRETQPITISQGRDYSQHGEQEIIFKYFTEHAPAAKTLVDVGAFGQDMSNSMALLKQGWHGLLVEANPERAKIVRKEFAGLRVKILNLAIGISVGKAPLHLHSDAGHDSLDPLWHPGNATEKSVMVNTKPLAVVLMEQKIAPDFDFLSIDTEGLDMLIMSELLYKSAYRPRLICTECESYADAVGLYSQYGYTLLAKTGPELFGNFIFSKKV